MNKLTTTIYTDLAELPPLDESNFFHSSRLFGIFRQTPRHKPYMLVCRNADGQTVGHMLAIVRYRTSLLPPYLYSHCRILGEGVYYDSDQQQNNEVLGCMLKAAVKTLATSVLYIEVSHLSRKMVGYRQLRQYNFFGVRWMSIHNSLHSHSPEERLNETMMKRIASCENRGVSTSVVGNEQDFEAFMKLLKAHSVTKLHRFLPHSTFFRETAESNDGQLLLTRYKGHVIGCSMLVYSGRNAYLWYTAFRRKSFAFVHPDLMTIWHAMKYCHAQGVDHIFFMNVGLPFRKNSFREFILSFGGKPTSTLRWFRCSIWWINRLLSWIYRN